MAEKAKHAHGSRANLDAAITNKLVDAFDVLFLSGDNENPAMGWLDRDGNPIIISPADEVAEAEAKLEAEIAKKANTEDVSALGIALADKANVSDVETLGNQIASKANASEVEALEEAVANKVDAATVKALIEEYSSAVIEVIEF